MVYQIDAGPVALLRLMSPIGQLIVNISFKSQPQSGSSFDIFNVYIKVEIIKIPTMTMVQIQVASNIWTRMGNRLISSNFKELIGPLQDPSL